MKMTAMPTCHGYKSDVILIGDHDNRTLHFLRMSGDILKSHGLSCPENFGRKESNTELKLCKFEGCENIVTKRSPLCSEHTGSRRCEEENCFKCAQGSTKYCIAHGGGRRCTYPGCMKGARDKTYCAGHGGGKRCKVDQCSKSAVGGSELCTAHGGGRKCQVDGCKKFSQSPTSFCVKHGGGKKCQNSDCTKAARGRTAYCAGHGGGARCSESNCPRSAVARQEYCRSHLNKLLNPDQLLSFEEAEVYLQGLQRLREVGGPLHSDDFSWPVMSQLHSLGVSERKRASDTGESYPGSKTGLDTMVHEATTHEHDSTDGSDDCSERAEGDGSETETTADVDFLKSLSSTSSAIQLQSATQQFQRLMPQKEKTLRDVVGPGSRQQELSIAGEDDSVVSDGAARKRSRGQGSSKGYGVSSYVGNAGLDDAVVDASVVSYCIPCGEAQPNAGFEVEIEVKDMKFHNYQIEYKSQESSGSSYGNGSSDGRDGNGSSDGRDGRDGRNCSGISSSDGRDGSGIGSSDGSSDGRDGSGIGSSDCSDGRDSRGTGSSDCSDGRDSSGTGSSDCSDGRDSSGTGSGSPQLVLIGRDEPSARDTADAVTFMTAMLQLQHAASTVGAASALRSSVPECGHPVSALVAGAEDTDSRKSIIADLQVVKFPQSSGTELEAVVDNDEEFSTCTDIDSQSVVSLPTMSIYSDSCSNLTSHSHSSFLCMDGVSRSDSVSALDNHSDKDSDEDCSVVTLRVASVQQQVPLMRCELPASYNDGSHQRKLGESPLALCATEISKAQRQSTFCLEANPNASCAPASVPTYRPSAGSSGPEFSHYPVGHSAGEASPDSLNKFSQPTRFEADNKRTRPVPDESFISSERVGKGATAIGAGHSAIIKDRSKRSKTSPSSPVPPVSYEDQIKTMLSTLSAIKSGPVGKKAGLSAAHKAAPTAELPLGRHPVGDQMNSIVSQGHPGPHRLHDSHGLQNSTPLFDGYTNRNPLLGSWRGTGCGAGTRLLGVDPHNHSHQYNAVPRAQLPPATKAKLDPPSLYSSLYSSIPYGDEHCIQGAPPALHDTAIALGPGPGPGAGAGAGDSVTHLAQPTTRPVQRATHPV